VLVGAGTITLGMQASWHTAPHAPQLPPPGSGRCTRPPPRHQHRAVLRPGVRVCGHAALASA